jgi:hypothetical protein
MLGFDSGSGLCHARWKFDTLFFEWLNAPDNETLGYTFYQQDSLHQAAAAASG